MCKGTEYTPMVVLNVAPVTMPRAHHDPSATANTLCKISAIHNMIGCQISGPVVGQPLIFRVAG